MYTHELIDKAKNIPNFIGVFPLDKLPSQHHVPPFNFIVNTDTSNLPGRHWIAVHVDEWKTVLFDPVGIYYPPILCRHVIKFGRPIVYNWKQYQPITKPICGQYCLAWLRSINRGENHWLI